VTFVNRSPRYEIMSEEAVAKVDAAWRRLVSEIGLKVAHPTCIEALRRAGQTIEDGDVVKFDPDFVLEYASLAPVEFTLQARDPKHTVRIGGDHMVINCVGGPPFVRWRDERRDGLFEDTRRFMKLGQHFDQIDIGGGAVAPSDLPLETRYLDSALASITLTSKPLAGGGQVKQAVEDIMHMLEVVFGDAESIRRDPVLVSVANCNSPMEWDTRMLEVMVNFAEHRQPVIVTPFLLMGAMAPVTIPAALAQQFAEALTGIAIMELLSPGTPAILGSFLSNSDMQSGSPGFGGPEGAIGLLCSGQLARRYNLPWRSGGGTLTSSLVPDAQAAWESMNTLLPSFLACANWVAQSAGWLESGLVASFEKYVMDVEMVGMMKEQFTPLEWDDAEFAFDAHLEVGQGSHFFGTEHTLARFRDCFYRPILATTENFERWTRNGSKDSAERAAELVERSLEEYEQPPLDEAIEEELHEYVERRKTEILALA
jgi:trimethylamine--corrinoid protein Co-methyltransferase